ncbi:unnamed protein product [Diabrotica balteata]|uniref:Uncharacterized protein n=1 Tax=Diabrotica balteata TaxID=107213 RepID=A0A9N9SS06_DIABA|nr:unnamed protein product [Diabrotica balteata]
MRFFDGEFVRSLSLWPACHSKSQALALTRNCKTPPPTSAASVNERSSRESAERTLTPNAARSATPLENTVSPQSIKDDFDPNKTSSDLFVLAVSK